MRNNSARLSSDNENKESVEAKPSSDFSFVLSTEFIELPSKGAFYPADHPLYKKETVEIRHMTAKEEDLLTNQTAIKEGNVLDKLLSAILIDKEIDVEDLLVGDRNAIFYHTRRLAYGDDYDVKIRCSGCLKTFQQTFLLSSCLVLEEGEKLKELELTEDGTFVYNSDSIDAKVELRLLTGEDENHILELQRDKKKQKDFNLNQFLLTSSIVSVNGKEELVQKFIDEAPLTEVRKIKDYIINHTPKTKLIGERKCIHCGHAEEADIPIGLSFFRINS